MENLLLKLKPKNNKRPLMIVAALFLFFSTIALVFYFVYEKQTVISLSPNDKAVVLLGKTIYEQSCLSCHGAKLEGQSNWKSRNEAGMMPAPPHDKSGHTWHHADQLLFELTKFGLATFAGPDFKSDMPMFKDTLSDKEIIAVLSYIKSTWPQDIQDKQNQINQAYKQKSQ